MIIEIINILFLLFKRINIDELFWRVFFFKFEDFFYQIPSSSNEKMIFIISKLILNKNVELSNSFLATSLNSIRQNLTENFSQVEELNIITYAKCLSILEISERSIWISLQEILLKESENKYKDLFPEIEDFCQTLFVFGKWEILNNQKSGQSKFTEFWSFIENTFLKYEVEKFSENQISMIIHQFSLIGVSNFLVWSRIKLNLIGRVQSFSKISILRLLNSMNFNKNLQHAQLMRVLEAKCLKIFHEFSTNELIEIMSIFCEYNACPDILDKFESTMEQGIFDLIDFEFFRNIHIYLAYSEIKSNKIWGKFEDIILENKTLIRKDLKLILSIVKSFDLVNHGSEILWVFLGDMISDEIKNLEGNDLIDIIKIMRKRYTNLNFWKKIVDKIENSISLTSNMILEQYLVEIKENPYLSNYKELVKKIEIKLNSEKISKL